MRTARNWIIQVFLENHRLKSRRNLENGSLFPGTRPTFFLGSNWERLPRVHACIYRVCMWRHVYNCVCKPWASLGLVCQRSCVNVCVWVCECRRIDHGNCCDDHACVCVCVWERECVWRRECVIWWSMHKPLATVLEIHICTTHTTYCISGWDEISQRS